VVGDRMTEEQIRNAAYQAGLISGSSGTEITKLRKYITELELVLSEAIKKENECGKNWDVPYAPNYPYPKWYNKAKKLINENSDS